ncbi:TetR/AcrR family transcriptional regulator [Phycicoccus flavus]|uniref:TetR/AcrR family transcriptional regulator n=1 Tax=Phycicoccus flavus TaxID=2502783 RepID=UPI000FEBB34B|nr:TetR/AcrR family transcriptional regulator [Phycicoccus flavus]NHA67599.1 TetR/AcrR family transcriptional regulator [Phycicoccus flavus]
MATSPPRPAGNPEPGRPTGAPAPRGGGRRPELLAAAVHVVSDEGLRGLTHRAVDRRAGLPEGTCSAYLRTRGALLVALAEHVGGILEAGVTRLAGDLQGCAGDADAVAAAVTDLTTGCVRESAVVRAQAELSLEAGRRPELMEVFERWRHGLLATVEELGRATGRQAPARDAAVVVAAVEGCLVTAVRLPGPEREQFLRDAVPPLVRALHTGG